MLFLFHLIQFKRMEQEYFLLQAMQHKLVLKHSVGRQSYGAQSSITY